MIQYHSYYPNWKFNDKRKFNIKLRRFVSDLGYTLQDIHYIYGDDDWLLQINKNTFNHDYYTDIITLDYSIKNTKQLHIDMFISIDRVRENAELNQVSFEYELNRVMIHGVLHCMGFDDHTEQDKAIIQDKENDFLSLF